MKVILFFALVLLIVPGVMIPGVLAEYDTCVVHLSNINCRHCATVAALVFEETFEENPGLVIIEYETGVESSNLALASNYDEHYGTGFGVPLVVFGKDNFLKGAVEIPNNLLDRIKTPNSCPLPDGTIQTFSDLDLTSLPLKPNFWVKDRLLVAGQGGDAETLKILLEGDIEAIREGLSEKAFSIIDPEPFQIPGKTLQFENAIQIGDWSFYWNGESIDPDQPTNGKPPVPIPKEEMNFDLILGIMIVLAIGIILVFLKLKK